MLKAELFVIDDVNSWWWWLFVLLDLIIAPFRRIICRSVECFLKLCLHLLLLMQYCRIENRINIIDDNKTVWSSRSLYWVGINLFVRRCLVEYELDGHRGPHDPISINTEHNHQAASQAATNSTAVPQAIYTRDYSPAKRPLSNAPIVNSLVKVHSIVLFYFIAHMYSTSK